MDSQDVVIVDDGVYADTGRERQSFYAVALLERGALGLVELAGLVTGAAVGACELESLRAGVEDDTDRLGRSTDCRSQVGASRDSAFYVEG